MSDRDSWYPAREISATPAAAWIAALAVTFLITLGSPGPLPADDLQPGIDLLESPGPNFFPIDIPAGFFGPGSMAVNTTLGFVGKPLVQTAGDPIFNADTIIRRPNPASLGCPGTASNIPIEMVALSLVSQQPISVTFQGGGSELWNVQACASETVLSTGTMDVTQVCDEGGTFSSVLTVEPKLVFTRVGDGQTLVMDPAPEKELVLTDAQWIHQPTTINAREVNPGVEVDGDCDGTPDSALALGTSNFHPGIQAIPCMMCNATTEVEEATVPLPHDDGMDGMTPTAQHQVTILLFDLSAIPTLSGWGLILISLLLALSGGWLLYRRRAPAR